jgi:hypothetical protein
MEAIVKFLMPVEEIDVELIGLCQMSSGLWGSGRNHEPKSYRRDDSKIVKSARRF